MYVDICKSEEEAEFAERYHEKKGHTNITKKKGSDQVVVSLVEGDLPDYDRTGELYETGDQIWIVTANDS